MIRQVTTFSIECDGNWRYRNLGRHRESGGWVSEIECSGNWCLRNLGGGYDSHMVPIIMEMNRWKSVDGKVYCPVCQEKLPKARRR